ncbi:MAG: hypothetical protein EOQ39_33350 [Mesorhizobium sp.]|uniref:amidohydrolase family protein n=1 Tax=Mesorhizobium sp. TaxID=1871066 RepID=UPI000FE97FC9|nr:amidohydrolase family protein [Mesorhizobium sp.]RWA98509.1 MAG: hypothetical protein EOQ37_32970 [Mesorhizobium sp.]RWB09530.1 MAG: hypothetical protein EOQ39_33350 [Mesorhizobium sp.]
MTASQETCDLVITNACVLSLNTRREIFTRGAIAVKGRDIVAVGPEKEVTASHRAARIIDAGGGVAHPGLLDCHVHLMHNARGAFPDNTPWDQGMRFYARWRDLLNDVEEHAACLLACLEMAKNGTTFFMEAGTVLSPDVAAEAANDVGIRGSVADPMLWDIGGLSLDMLIRRAPVDYDRSIRELGGQLRRNQEAHSLVRGHIAVYGGGTASDELIRAAKSCADAAGAIYAQHQSFSAEDVDADCARFGEPPLLHFEKLGVLGPRSIFTHLNIVSDEEFDAIRRSGLSTVWCVSSSMVWGVGGTIHGRHPEMHQCGIPVGFGSDSANSCGRFDPSFQGCLAVLTAREKSRNRDALSFEEALEIATVGGARAVGMQDVVGSLEPGKRADIVIRSPDVPEMQPGVDPVQAIMFSAGSKGVDTVIVDGRIIIENGRSTLVDEERIYALARESASRMIHRVDEVIKPRWPRQ